MYLWGTKCYIQLTHLVRNRFWIMVHNGKCRVWNGDFWYEIVVLRTIYRGTKWSMKVLTSWLIAIRILISICVFFCLLGFYLIFVGNIFALHIPKGKTISFCNWKSQFVFQTYIYTSNFKQVWIFYFIYTIRKVKWRFDKVNNI